VILALTAFAIDLSVRGHVVHVEIADSPELRERGLMFRESLAVDAGMLFVYPAAAPRRFWMKDTPLPLDIAFADARGEIVSVVTMKPLDLTPVPSGKPAMYALEMAARWFADHGVGVGDTLIGLPAGSAH
jgi:uncharacterized membrane protein (UPF0127 family)